MQIHIFCKAASWSSGSSQPLIQLSCTVQLDLNWQLPKVLTSLVQSSVYGTAPWLQEGAAQHLKITKKQDRDANSPVDHQNKLIWQQAHIFIF